MLKIIFIISFLKYIMCSDINKYENVNAIIGGNIISFNNGIYNNYFYRCLLKDKIQNNDNYNLEIKYNVTTYKEFTKCNHNNKFSLCINLISCYLKYNNGQYIYIKNYDLSTLDGTCPTIINNKTCLIDIWKEEIKI